MYPHLATNRVPSNDDTQSNNMHSTPTLLEVIPAESRYSPAIVPSPSHSSKYSETARSSTETNVDRITSHRAAISDTYEKAKQHIGITAAELDDCRSLPSCESHPNQTKGKVWETRLLRIGPIIGICGILLAVLSSLVSLSILIASRDAPVTSWTIPPSTYLAICVAVSNQAIRFAAFHGVAIAWWFKATRGSTLAKLHSDWHAGTHVLGAIAAGPKMGFLGLACIFSTLVAVDGPLLQKATTIRTALISDQPFQLNVTLCPELPTHEGGGYIRSSGTQDRWTTFFNDTIPSSNGNISNNLLPLTSPYIQNHVGKPWLLKTALTGIVRGCPGTCKAKVKAPALTATACTSQEVHADWRNLRVLQGSSQREALPLDQMPFIIQPVLSLKDGMESVDLVTAFAHVPRCVGIITVTACNLVSAVGEYAVTVENDTVTIDNNSEPRIVALANNTGVSEVWDAEFGWYSSTLAAAVSLAAAGWQAYVYTDPSRDAETATYHDAVVEQFVEETQYLQCRSYSDPRERVMKSLNEMMFYYGAILPTMSYQKGENFTLVDKSFFDAHLDPGLEVNSTVTGYLQGTQDVFRTELLWFLAAAVVDGICIALILPTYFGWWRLGRAVSFSPLEIAKAFEAPLLSECNSNATGRDMVKVVGSHEVQYGAAQDGDTTKLAFAHPKSVTVLRDAYRLNV